jgi:outer membrane protein OmpA-like peptidoglycan-associated protein
MKKPLIPLSVFAASLVFVSSLSAETFTFQFVRGDKYRFVTVVHEKVLMNDVFHHGADYLTKITYEVTGVKRGAGAVSAVNQVSVRRSDDPWGFSLEEEYPSTFVIGPRGQYAIDGSLIYPLTRGIPSFPEGNLKPGSAWTAPGEEAHDFRAAYGIREPYRIPVDVRYTFTGMKTLDGRKLAQIDIAYSSMTKVRGVVAPGGLYPIMIAGTYHKTLLWDLAAGRPASYQEDFDVIYTLSSGAVAEFVGEATGAMIVSRPLDTVETARAINREIDKNRLEGVRAESVEHGVKITLENVQFQPDSDVITEGEAGKIQTIALILKKYPGRDIKLVGHTAAFGSPESCLELSVRRAKAVGDVLLKLGARRAEEMTVQGKGLTEPVAPNDTEAGRIKNRRVEIVILEN